MCFYGSTFGFFQYYIGGIFPITRPRSHLAVILVEYMKANFTRCAGYTKIKNHFKEAENRELVIIVQLTSLEMSVFFAYCTAQGKRNLTHF